MEFTASDLWSRVLEGARTGMPEQSYRTWLQETSAVGLSDDGLLIEVPSEFHVEWIEDKYGGVLNEVLRQILGRPLDLSFRVAALGEGPARIPTLEVASPQPSPPTVPTSQSPSDPGSGLSAAHSSGLNERYTFDRFVVGNNNQLAAAASHAVAERPARIYNPLFLYGGVGLGKTHLMHAVGRVVLDRDPTKQVAYVTSERFMNELVNSIQTGTTAAFRRRYRQIDLLLVDDVHFLESKEGTQEEFFHTFNALYDAGRQIILTSDRPPKDLPGVEERLVSRFEWGLVVDLKPPDYETRVAILRKKASDDNLTLDDEIIDFIAVSCTASVRELEGAVIKLLAYSSLRNEEITLELAQTALQGVLRPGRTDAKPTLTMDGIRERVAREWQVTPQELASKRRTKQVTLPRQVAMYLIKELLDESLVDIGRFFGGRDHSTVIHSIRKVEETLEVGEGDELALRVQHLRAELEG